MRIAKGRVDHLYQKGKDIAGREVINISLSSLSRQDTFIQIKERMRMALDFVGESENIRDIPNVMSEKFQFQHLKPNVVGSYFHSFDRLMNVT